MIKANFILIIFLIINSISIFKIENNKILLNQIILIAILFIKTVSEFYFKNEIIHFLSHFFINHQIIDQNKNSGHAVLSN